MKAFRFPLDRALQWRKLQCEMEQAASMRIAAERATLTAKLESISEFRKNASDSLVVGGTVSAAEFQTLAGFNSWADREKLRIRAAHDKLEKEAQAQLLRTAEARRKQKLLETLRAARLKKWTALRDLEDEQAAADAWLSRFAAERYTTHHVS